MVTTTKPETKSVKTATQLTVTVAQPTAPPKTSPTSPKPLTGTANPPTHQNMAMVIESETRNATTETPSTPTDAPTLAPSTPAGPVQKSLAGTSASVPPTTTYTKEPASAHALTEPTETATQTSARPVTLPALSVLLQVLVHARPVTKLADTHLMVKAVVHSVVMAKEVAKRLVTTVIPMTMMGAVLRVRWRKAGSVRESMIRSPVDVMRAITQSKAPVPEPAAPASTQTPPP